LYTIVFYCRRVKRQLLTLRAKDKFSNGEDSSNGSNGRIGQGGGGTFTE
jgi:hypothetical protein